MHSFISLSHNYCCYVLLLFAVVVKQMLNPSVLPSLVEPTVTKQLKNGKREEKKSVNKIY